MWMSDSNLASAWMSCCQKIDHCRLFASFKETGIECWRDLKISEVHKTVFRLKPRPLATQQALWRNLHLRFQETGSESCQAVEYSTEERPSRHGSDCWSSGSCPTCSCSYCIGSCFASSFHCSHLAGNSTSWKSSWKGPECRPIFHQTRSQLTSCYLWVSQLWTEPTQGEAFLVMAFQVRA